MLAPSGIPYDGRITDLATPGFIFTNMEQFKKAVTAGYGTDVAALTGGGALRLQSIEPTLLRTIQEDTEFVLFNKLAQSNASATVDEWTIKDAIGGFPGSGFNSELGVMASSQGSYARKVGLVKYLMVRREVSVVQESQKTIVDTIAEEKVDGAREIKTTVEWGMFNGDSAVVDLEFDGIATVLRNLGGDGIVLDAHGKGLSYIGDEVINIAQQIRSYGRFGTATDYFCSLAVQASEFDQKLKPGYRVNLERGKDAVEVGTPVSGVRTSFGNILANPDVFIEEGQPPWDGRTGRWPGLATASTLLVPAGVGVAAAGGTAGVNQFTAGWDGNYFYGVESCGRLGRSGSVVSAQVTLAVGQKAVVTITNPADANVTGFVIHRSRKNGTNAKADLREMIRIPRQGGASTVYNDENLDIPGTSKMFVLNMKPGMNAINLRRLLPMTLFPLYPTNTATRPWSQLFFCYLRIAKPMQHGMVKNILPGSATWLPA